MAHIEELKELLQSCQEEDDYDMFYFMNHYLDSSKGKSPYQIIEDLHNGQCITIPDHPNFPSEYCLEFGYDDIITFFADIKSYASALFKFCGNDINNIMYILDQYDGNALCYLFEVMINSGKKIDDIIDVYVNIFGSEDNFYSDLVSSCKAENRIEIFKILLCYAPHQELYKLINDLGYIDAIEPFMCRHSNKGYSFDQ